MSNQEQELEQSAELINDEQQTPDAAEPAVATDELSALQQQLSAAEAAAQEEKDRALRIAAEMENLRRRAAQDVEKAHKFALEKFTGEYAALEEKVWKLVYAGRREKSRVLQVLARRRAL